MKKIFSIFILAVSGILSAAASQSFSVTSVNNTQTIYFRINKTSGNVTRSKTTASGSAATVALTENDTYWQTFAVTTGSGDYKTITFTLPDDVTYLEIYSNKGNVAVINVSSMSAYLASLNLSGCTNLTTLTLGTMASLTDVDVSNTSAAVANTVTASKCPVLENLNVANCSLTSLAYTGSTLYSLDVTGNSIPTLNISGNANLDIVRCEGNGMTSLTVSSAVTTISAHTNSLMNLTGYGESIMILDVASNGLTTINMDGLSGLTDLDISSNHLTFRSFPSADNKPVRMLYTGNDGLYDLSGSMKAAFGSYSYPLQSKLPEYASRNETSFTVDLTDARLDGDGVQSVVPVINRYNGSVDTPLTLSSSDSDGKDYTTSTDGNLYGFMKAQDRVRFSFTNANYPGLTLYSNQFTVPEGVNGTLQIVDEDGSELFTIAKVVFSDATDGIPAKAVRDYTKYTIPAMPTKAGETWRIIAGPSDDAPFAWASTYGSATWYYMSVGVATNKWATAGESNGSAGTAYGGHALKSSYSTTDNYYQWAFVGNQYDGFKIYNKGCGESQTLQDYSGYSAPYSGGAYPTMRNGSSLTWIVRTNSSGTGFSLENKGGGTVSGVSAPCYLNNYAALGYLNYWITNDDDAQNDPGSRFTLVQASAPAYATVKWIILDDSNNPVYNISQDVTSGSTVSSYPEELTTIASQRFVTLPALTPFVASGGQVVKNVNYTWTGPFDLTTDVADPHLYYFKSARYGYYAYAPVGATGTAKQSSQSKSAITPRGRWFFTGDPFNGIEIRPYSYPEMGLTGTSLSTIPMKYIPRANPDITTNYWDNALPSAAISFVNPTSTAYCLSEQLGTWYSSSINSDKGVCFVVEDAEDISMLITPGLYQVRCVGNNLTSKYWKLDSSDHKLYNNGNPEDKNTVFRIQENANASSNYPDSYYIAGFDGDEAWYFDNLRTSYSQQFTTTQNPDNYVAAQIVYNAKVGDTPYYAIKLSTQSSYSGYSYANTNSSITSVVTWAYTSGTADGSAWAIEPVACVNLNTVGDNSYATFYFNRDVQTDENTKAYYVLTTDNGSAQLTEVENEGHDIPAYTAVVLVNSAKKPYRILPVKIGLASVVDAETNLLKGTLVDMELDLSDNTTYYSLGKKNDKIGFYKFEKSGSSVITLGANKAYLDTPAASSVRGFVFDVDNNTGISTMDDVRCKTDNIYDLSGRHVDSMKHGIYIINGKKIIK